MAGPAGGPSAAEKSLVISGAARRRLEQKKREATRRQRVSKRVSHPRHSTLKHGPPRVRASSPRNWHHVPKKLRRRILES